MILKNFLLICFCVHLSACLNSQAELNKPHDGAEKINNSQTSISTDVLNAFDKSLREDLLDPYYPTAHDPFGGFAEDRNRTWRLQQNDDKFVVTQARYTWTAAKASLFYADNPSQSAIYLDSAALGLEFLTRMWGYDYDGITGIALISDRDGSNGRIGNKKNLVVYGNAFALFSAAAYFGASGEQAAFDFAIRIYKFLDEYAYDTTYGGYYVTASNTEKDTNVNLHVLEALTSLYQVMPESHGLSPKIASRISELLSHLHDDVIHCESETDCFAYPKMNRNWTVKDNSISFGHDVELAYLMVEAIIALGQNLLNSRYIEKIKNMVDFTYTNAGYRNDGGLYYAGIYNDDEVKITENRLSWWVQAESLNALCMMQNIFPDEPYYTEKLKLSWQFIENNIIDKNVHGWVRKAGDWSATKAFEWHSNYHNSRALMNCLNWYTDKNENREFDL